MSIDGIAQTILEMGRARADAAARDGAIQSQAIRDAADARARATAANGQIWGQTLAQLGQLPGQVMQQVQQQKTLQLQQQQQQLILDRAQQWKAGEEAYGRISANLPSNPDGTKDITKIDQFAGADKLQPDQRQALIQQATELNQHIVGAKNDKLNRLGDVANMMLGYAKSSGQPPSLMTMGLVAKSLSDAGIVTPDETQEIAKHLVAGVDPTAMLETIKSQAPKYAKDATPIDVAPGHSLVDRNTMKPTFTAPEEQGKGDYTINGQRFKANGAPIGSVVPPQTPKAPGSLEEQYLTAVTAGDQSTAARILSTIKATSDARKDPATADLARQLQQLNVSEAQARLDNLRNAPTKQQESLEQQYRTGLITKVESSRSGGLGLEDQKVNQAVHLLTLFEQTKNPKTGEYEIPKMMIPEVALGLARLISPTGTPAESTVKDLEQKTAKGDLAGIYTYLTGKPITGSTQDIFKVFRDSIERQGTVAEENRGRYLAAAQAAAPTDLEQSRRESVEKGLLSLTSVKRGDYKTGGVSVTAPNGKTYSFPTQADADAFKAKAGIK